MKVIHIIKRIEIIDEDIKDLRKLEKSLTKNKAFTTPIYMSIEKQINILLGERIKLLELQIMNPPKELLEQIEGSKAKEETTTSNKEKEVEVKKAKTKKAKEKPIQEELEDREIPMNYAVFETLKALPQDQEYVFFNPKTSTYIKDVKNSFKAACNDANIEGFRFHDLRHTAASIMVHNAKVDIVTVSKILGHSSTEMTERYIHTTTDNMREAVTKLAKVYEQTRQKVDSPTEEVEIKSPQLISN